VTTRTASSVFLFNAPIEAAAVAAPSYVISYIPPSNRSFAEFAMACESVEELACQQGDWDGYGALPISHETKANAMAALSGLQLNAPAPNVIPNPNGTLSFEWETDEGIGHLEIGRTRYSFYVRPNIGPAILLDGSAQQVHGLGAIIAGYLYPKPSEPAYTRIQTATNV